MNQDRPYGRVTNPERFAPLHSAVHALIGLLAERYDVEVQEVEPEGAHLRHAVLAARRLSPANGGAPVTITFTAFPGLSVRFGSRHVEMFPRCGCDACEEQAEVLIDDLRRMLTSVAEGQFRETAHGYEFTFPDGNQSGDDPDSPERSPHEYPAWPLRPYEQEQQRLRPSMSPGPGWHDRQCPSRRWPEAR